MYNIQAILRTQCSTQKHNKYSTQKTVFKFGITTF